MNIKDLSDNATITAAAKVQRICTDHRAKGSLCDWCIFVIGKGCRVGNPYGWDLPAKIIIPKEATE